MKTFKHLKQNDRDRIEILLDQGMTQKSIALVLQVDKSTVSREIKKRKKSNGEYDATSAQHKAYVKRKYSKYQGMKVESDILLKKYIIENLEHKRSPDEIAGKMKKDHAIFYVGKDAIYRWLYSARGQRYCHYLCTQHYYKKKRKGSSKRSMIPNPTSIHDRPLGATNKTRYKHFEADTIVAPKKVDNNQSIAIAVERKIKFILAQKISSLACFEMNKAVDNFSNKAHMFTTTLDRGIENRGHESWNTKTYFADPHSPWQKPVVENTIGLLRRWFFKKGTDWSKVTEKELQDAISILNNKYRKSLNYCSASELALKHGIIKSTSL